MTDTAADTAASSIITDHAFKPRLQPVVIKTGTILPTNPYLCQHCGLAEAAHRP